MYVIARSVCPWHRPEETFQAAFSPEIKYTGWQAFNLLDFESKSIPEGGRNGRKKNE
jgi:hypothetical protein